MFEPVLLKWEGREYTVPADQVMGLIDTVEDVVTLDELYKMQSEGKIKRMQVSKAYAAAINYGIRASESDDKPVKAQEIYESLYSKESALVNTVSTIGGLMAMLLPPDMVKKSAEEGEEPGEPQAAEG